MDFGNTFAENLDPLVFDTLADTVEVVHPTLGTHTLQAEFTRGRFDKELYGEIDDFHPQMIIKDADYYLFEDHEAVVNYNSESYKVHDDEPYFKLLHKIRFKDDR